LIDFEEFGSLDLMYGREKAISLRSPAGLRVDVQEFRI